MLELYAFAPDDDRLDPLRARHVLELRLDVDECRRLGQTPFLSAVFFNQRFQDSCGTEAQTSWADGATRPGVVFTPADLDALAAKYAPWREAVGGSASSVEAALWRYLEACRGERLRVVSLSRFFAQEYE